jgi:excisionase family DNA binding protein
MSEGQWLTPQEVADELKVSSETILRAIHEGDLGAAQIGPEIRISRKSLDEWLDRRFLHPEKWLTIESIAQRFDVDIKTVRRWLRSEKLQGYQLGEHGEWRVKESDLQEFLKSNRRLHPPAGE